MGEVADPRHQEALMLLQTFGVRAIGVAALKDHGHPELDWVVVGLVDRRAELAGTLDGLELVHPRFERVARTGI
jgi:hypothetical protein